MCNRTSTAYITRLFHYFSVIFRSVQHIKVFQLTLNFIFLKFVFSFPCYFWFFLNFLFKLQILFSFGFIIEHSLVVQLVSKFRVHNALTKTNVCGGHARMVVSALIWNHPENTNAIVHSVIRE